MNYNKNYRGPITARPFDSIKSPEERAAFDMEARNAASNILSKHQTVSPEFRYQVAKYLQEMAREEVQASRAASQPRDDQGRFQNPQAPQGRPIETQPSEDRLSPHSIFNNLDHDANSAWASQFMGEDK